ncbi:MAG: hypothetical protein RL148_3053, partial [Planctomycetota bacterium]
MHPYHCNPLQSIATHCNQGNDRTGWLTIYR